MRIASVLRGGIPAAALIGLVLLPGAPRAGVSADPWPVAGGTPEHAATASGPAPPYEVAWETTLEDAATPIAGPVLGAGVVVIPGRREVVALDPATGRERWSVERAAGAAGGAAVAEDLVVFTEGSGDEAAAVAVGLEDGEEAWRAPIDDRTPGGVTISEGTAYLGTISGTVYALDLEDGSVRWTAGTGRRESEEGGPEDVRSTPAVSGGAVVVTAEDRDERTGSVYALEEASGERRWTARPEGNVAGFSSPSVSGGTVFVGGGDIQVHAFALDDGRERWAVRTRAPFGSLHVPAAAAGEVLIADVLGHVFRLDPRTGVERWMFRVPGFFTTGSISLSGDTVLAGDDDGQVSAIDLRRGVLVWKRTVGERPVGAVAADGERLYVAARSGTVLGLSHHPNGELLDEPSPTTLFPGEALLNYAGGFAIVLVLILGLFRLLPRREG